MKTIFYILIIFALSFYIYSDNEELRSRTGVIESVDIFNGAAPKNISKVFPEIIQDQDTGFIIVEMVLDVGRKLSIYDYALKSIDNTYKYKCVAVGDKQNFDSENWEIGPFDEKRKVYLLFICPKEKILPNAEFLFSFELPIGYNVPSVKLNIGYNKLKQTQIAHKQPENNNLQISQTENAKATNSLPDKKKISQPDKVQEEKKTSEEANNQSQTEGIIEKISVNPKSFTFYVKTDDGRSLKICPYGIIPAEDEKLHPQIGKALQNKYIGKKIKISNQGTDRYGRIIGKMYENENYINKQMIEDGFAFYSWKYAPNDAELQDVKTK